MQSLLGRVRIGSLTSSWRNVERGCPQVLVLAIGPLLWNTFQNDLSYNLASGLSMIYVKGEDTYTIVAKLQESTSLATNWYDSNLLQGNLKKYQTMKIRNKSVNFGDKASTTVNVKDVMESDNLQLLGVTGKLHLFKAAILPHLPSCHFVWHLHRASDTRTLERVQERGLRAVFS